jgi:RNA polymerase sigma-70 factor (sigma-E family)
MGKKAGAVAAFEAFVRSRGSALLRTAFLLTGDHGRAEDLVQTALGKAWPHWASIRDGGQEGYVRRVMVTTYIGWWRRRWTDEFPSDSLPEQAFWGPNLDVRRDLLKALASLPKGQRAVVVLRYFDDLTEAQTATLMGCSLGTVKSQTARALAALRTCPALAVTQGDVL